MHIIQLLPELNQGGVERGTVELSRELVKRGHRSTVISAGGKMAEQIEQDGGRHITLDVCSKNPFTAPLRIYRLRKILQGLAQGLEVGRQTSEIRSQKSAIRSQTSDVSKNPEPSFPTSDLRSPTSVIHARSRVPAWLCYFANKKLKIPFVTTVHGFNSVSWYSKIMTQGDAVICVSNPVKKYIQDNYGTPDEKITVIHRGIDPSEFDLTALDRAWMNSFKEKYGLNDKFVVTAVGRITELKDYETFIRAVASCDVPNIKGVIVGGVRHDKQAYFERLQALVKELGVEQRIVFAGSQNCVPEIYTVSDVLVSCSKKPESFGRTLIEAMAMNTPVVASAHGGPLDILIDGENGLFFEPGNDRDLAEKIERALTLEFSNIRSHIEKNFSLERMTEDELAVYKSLTNIHPE